MPINSYPDFLIVGQGLAGTLMAHFLLEEGKTVNVIGKSLPGASSEIAAGIVNPVTGRRFAKSWRFEKLFPFAKQTYQQLESLLDIPIWKERNVLRALINQIDQNEWERRSIYPEYNPYIVEPADLGQYRGKLKVNRQWGELKYCAQVAMPQLVDSYRKYLESNGFFMEEKFDFNALAISGHQLQYKNLSPSHIIFCEGAKAAYNPYFNFLPFSPTKGELLMVRIPGGNFDKMLKHKVFIVPLGGDVYWIGSTSHFTFEDDFPTPDRRVWLEEKLSELLNIPYEIISHKAAIRPTVFDIRPFLGRHPVHKSLLIFNGLGTKGASLGPYFAHQLAGYLCGKNEIDAEVDIRRFEKQ